MINDRIVADGRDRLLKAPEVVRQIREATGEIRRQYGEKMKGANLLRRLALWIEMHREMRKAADRIAPKGGCYARSD